jgi:hypothetical protein
MIVPSLIFNEVTQHNARPLVEGRKPEPDRALWFLTENFAWVMSPQRPDGIRDIIIRVKL